MSELFLKHDLRGVIINSWDTFRLIFNKWSREIDENNSLAKNAFSEFSKGEKIIGIWKTY